MTDAPAQRAAIRSLTQARLSFGAARPVANTRETLAFALDHARAREAVTTDIDVAALQDAVAAAGLQAAVVNSAAETRETFVKRPDLGRALAAGAHEALAALPPCDVALVLGDGLSSVAVTLNGVPFMAALSQRLSAGGLTPSPIVIARQARVALGDRVALALKAKTVVIALGERPGLSAADGLGAYVTQNPRADTPDSARNCVSNIREMGLRVDDAAAQVAALVLAIRARDCSGVAFNRLRSADLLPKQADDAGQP